MEPKEPEILIPEIAAARERRALAEAKSAARAAASAERDAIREELDGAALAEAIAEHGEVGDAIAFVTTKAGRVIVKRPTSARWRQASKEMESREQAKLEENAKRLVLDHLVYPEREAYFAIADRYPALSGELIAMIGGLARGGSRALSGE